YLSADSLQGDARFVDVLERMGCQVERAANYLEVRSSGQLRGVDVDLNAMSDTAQTLAAIAPFASSPTHIRNIGHIRHKETDRIAAVATELRKLGAQVEESADALTIYPSVLQPTEIETYDDHRMAMAFSVTGLALGGVRIKNPSCTAKTFPDYFKRFEALYG
ncbi:MAG: 3-phosphoshikimate 1-carboxyvinyltransferase, partial [Candidatus Thermofonsia Clade 1 bacterium]